MIAIAESGSTKCEWVVLNNFGSPVKRFKTIGFNPDFHNRDQVSYELMKSSEINEIRNQLGQVYFYGAGCSSDLLKGQIHCGLSSVFENAQILVDHDLLAAAYSLYHDQPVIACILGTGCNSAYFDGVNLSQSVPSLGFLLGDEGGGGYFGKILLRDYFYGQLPPHLAVDFNASYQLEWETVRKRLYQDERPNVFAASFMPFLSKHINHPYVKELMEKGFNEFVDFHLTSFSNAKDCEISFVGSIAYYFQDYLKEALNNKGYRFGRIIQSPIDALVDYHLKHIIHTKLWAKTQAMKVEKDHKAK